MKVGIVTKGAENDDNKGLVWVGYPANFASRLTDCANKEFTDIKYQVDATFIIIIIGGLILYLVLNLVVGIEKHKTYR